jgi:hypothetical protein
LLLILTGEIKGLVIVVCTVWSFLEKADTMSINNKSTILIVLCTSM